MRSKTGHAFLTFFFLAAFSAGGPAQTAGTSASAARLERLHQHILAACADPEGKVGVAVKHLESGEELLINADEPFPMASTFKVPILVEVMAQVREGKIALEEDVSVQPQDQHIGSGMLSSLKAPGIKLSVMNLCLLMMTISDNSATDILLGRVGAENVNRRLRRLGIEGLLVSRPCQKLILDLYGLDYEAHKAMSAEDIEDAYEKSYAERPGFHKDVRRRFTQDPQDQATPRAMNLLLEKIAGREILDPQSCDLILGIMLECQTGAGRLKGLLPGVTPVAHKTGTIGGTFNDVGIISLPGDLGHVALTVLTKDFDNARSSDVDSIIAEVARFVYDYFTFTL